MKDEERERTMVRVLIADDHPVFRFGLRTLLKADPTIEVVGEATNGEEVLIAASQLAPDVILMDLNMPGMSGIEAIQRILLKQPLVIRVSTSRSRSVSSEKGCVAFGDDD